DIPGSTAFVPSVVGLIIAGEVIKDLTKDVIVKAEE
ncbi:MAG: tRNA threonylcarbamoyladenosine dehydratase, partial [Clostridium sp.]